MTNKNLLEWFDNVYLFLMNSSLIKSMNFDESQLFASTKTSKLYVLKLIQDQVQEFQTRN